MKQGTFGTQSDIKNVIYHPPTETEESNDHDMHDILDGDMTPLKDVPQQQQIHNNKTKKVKQESPDFAWGKKPKNYTAPSESNVEQDIYEKNLKVIDIDDDIQMNAKSANTDNVAQKMQKEFDNLQSALLNINLLLQQSKQKPENYSDQMNSAISLWNAILYRGDSNLKDNVLSTIKK